MQNGAAPAVASNAYEVTIVDAMTRFVIVAINLPDRWLFYTRPNNNEASYARGKAWSYPHRAPSFTGEAAGHFQHEFDRVNYDEQTDRATSMAILSLLHDTVAGAVPIQFNIQARRIAISRHVMFNAPLPGS